MASELFFTELETLAFFNYKVTFPFLHLIESTQEQLLQIQLQLYQNLLNKNVDTLNKYVVDIRNIVIAEPTSLLGKQIIDMMCIDAADAILLQGGRKYGFSDSVAISSRATDLSSLDAWQLKGLPSNNLIGERLLAVFDKRASKVSKCRNHLSLQINQLEMI